MSAPETNAALGRYYDVGIRGCSHTALSNIPDDSQEAYNVETIGSFPKATINKRMNLHTCFPEPFWRV